MVSVNMLPDLGELYPEGGLVGRLDELRGLKVVIIGFGKMGLLHSTILSLLLQNPPRAIVDKSLTVRLGFSRLFGKKAVFHKNLEDALRDGADLIYVTTPTPSHYPILRTILSREDIRGVFVEKPPTATHIQLKELAGAVGRRAVMVGLQKRYSLPFRHGKILLEEGAVGEIEGVECYIKSGDILEKTSRFDAVGRGVLLDLGIHLVDMLSWLFGDLRVEEAAFKSIYTNVDDHFWLRLSSRDGFEIRAEVTWSDPAFRVPETLIRIRGSRGSLEVTEDYLKITSPQLNKAFYRPHYYQGLPPVLVADPEFTIENMHLLLRLLDGGEPATSLRRSEPGMRIVEEAYSKAEKIG